MKHPEIQEILKSFTDLGFLISDFFMVAFAFLLSILLDRKKRSTKTHAWYVIILIILCSLMFIVGDKWYINISRFIFLGIISTLSYFIFFKIITNKEKN